MNRLPTTDIYFRNACRRWIRPGWLPQSACPTRPIRQIAANAYTCGEWLVLIRRDTPAVMRAALAWRGRLAYLVDDDIAGAADSMDLPVAYRLRLAAFDRDWHRHLLTRADVLVVPSAPLAARLDAGAHVHAEIRRIEPCWAQPFADQSHFAGLAQGKMLRVAHLGTGSHGGALAALTPVLAKVIGRDASVQFTYIAAPPGNPALAAQTGTCPEPPRRWPAYRRWLTRQRFHLALYPLLPTPFDRARSANKLFEHAIVGAVGLYPEDWQPARDLALASPKSPAALFAPATIADWGDAIAGALAGRDELALIAAAANQTLSTRQGCAMQQSLWGNILGIAIS